MGLRKKKKKDRKIFSLDQEQFSSKEAQGGWRGKRVLGLRVLSFP